MTLIKSRKKFFFWLWGTFFIFHTCLNRCMHKAHNSSGASMRARWFVTCVAYVKKISVEGHPCWFHPHVSTYLLPELFIDIRHMDSQVSNSSESETSPLTPHEDRQRLLTCYDSDLAVVSESKDLHLKVQSSAVHLWKATQFVSFLVPFPKLHPHPHNDPVTSLNIIT